MRRNIFEYRFESTYTRERFTVYAKNNQFIQKKASVFAECCLNHTVPLNNCVVIREVNALW